MIGVIRALTKQLEKLDLPFKYTIQFFDEETEELCDALKSPIFYLFIYADTEEICLYCDFPLDYPFRPPSIYFDEPIAHPMVDGEGKVDLGDWAAIMDLNCLFNNVYCVYLESKGK